MVRQATLILDWQARQGRCPIADPGWQQQDGIGSVLQQLLDYLSYQLKRWKNPELQPALTILQAGPILQHCINTGCGWCEMRCEEFFVLVKPPGLARKHISCWEAPLLSKPHKQGVVESKV